MTDDPNKPRPGDPGYIGYGSPPEAHQFKKGKSGNPAGRPPKRQSEEELNAYEEVARQTVPFTANGEVLYLTQRDAFEYVLRKRGLAGDPIAWREIDRREKRNERLARSVQAETCGGVLMVPHPPEVQAKLDKLRAQRAQVAPKTARKDDHGSES